MEWYDIQGKCQPPIENCLEKENVSGCKKCKDNFKLSGASPQSCIKLVCPQGTNQDINGACQEARSIPQGSLGTTFEAAKYTMAATSAVLMPLSASAGVEIIKIIQVFDYLGFVDVEKPINADAVL